MSAPIEARGVCNGRVGIAVAVAAVVVAATAAQTPRVSAQAVTPSPVTFDAASVKQNKNTDAPFRISPSAGRRATRGPRVRRHSSQRR